MATIVCQGLQSCLDSHLVEPRTVRLKMSSPKPHFSQPLELALKSCFLDSNTKEVGELSSNNNNNHQTSSNPDLGGWSFLQALSTTPSSIEKDNTTTYVHPLVKRSWSKLSEKSLELCTENLGNETGTDINESNIIFSLPSCDSNSEGGNLPTMVEQPKSRQLFGAKSKKANLHNFPPPLTTISGMESLRVRPHREDGRLIIKAVKAPAKHTYFQTERSQGRLRLSLFKTCTSTPSSLDLSQQVTNELASEGDGKDGLENDTNEEEKKHVEELELEEEEEDEVDDDVGEIKDVYLGGEEKDGNNANNCCEAEMGKKEKFERPRRCKEGEKHEKKRMINWEPLWVASS
jgi:hypothetical protein